MTIPFPDNFAWGVATASYQLEGGATAGGRGPSIWDTFSHTPGCIKNGDTGDVSTDHYHRYREDVQLMRGLGVGAYRFSISWSRVLPDGTGQVNEAGCDFYSRLVDELLANGITPWVTLYHWDLPQALEDRHGGWMSRDCALAFGEYAAVVADRLSDRVSRWFTVNEFWNVIEAGYQYGFKAPGRKCSEAEAVKTRHHLLLGHGLAVQALRQSCRQPPRIGLADALHAPMPVIPTPENIAAARQALRDSLYTSTVMEGRYPAGYLAHAAAALPAGWEADMPSIGAKLDFVGANCYIANYIEADAQSPSGYRTLTTAPSHPAMGISWLRFEPDALYWICRLLSEVWQVPEIVISESGCCSDDTPDAAGRIVDTDRAMYLRSVLRGAQRVANRIMTVCRS